MARTTKALDHEQGRWLKKIIPKTGKPISRKHKINPWEDPYNYPGSCLELADRIIG